MKNNNLIGEKLTKCRYELVVYNGVKTKVKRVVTTDMFNLEVVLRALITHRFGNKLMYKVYKLLPYKIYVTSEGETTELFDSSNLNHKKFANFLCQQESN